MEIKEYLDRIIDNDKLEDMQKLSDIFEKTMEHLEKCDKNTFDKYEMELYEMANGERLTDKMKIEWVENMHPIAKWNLQDIEKIYSRYAINMPLHSFYVIMNMLYSDMNTVFGTGEDEQSLSRYIKGSENWYYDEDATNTEEQKLYFYWKYIVK